MAQGSRGRFALLGAGMLLCTGLVGCMDSDPKPLKLKGSQMGSTVKPNQTGTGTTYGGGVQPASWNTPAGRTPNNDYFKTGAPGGTSTFGAPSVPGATGTGASMAPSGSGVVPPIAPPGGQSNYPTDGGYQGSTLPSNPPTLGYDVTMPPTPPTGAGYPAVSPGYPMPPQAPTKP